MANHLTIFMILDLQKIRIIPITAYEFTGFY